MANEAQQRSEPRPSTRVVTSENAAEFYAKELNLEQPPSKPPKSEDSDPAKSPAKDTGEKGGEAESKAAAKVEDAEAEAALEEERDREQDPKKQRLNKRFSELTGERNLARNERDAAREEAKREREARMALEAKVKQSDDGDRAKGEATEGEAPRPKRSEFTKDDAGQEKYEDALLGWDRKKREAEENQRRETEARDAKRGDWNKNLSAVRADIPDYDAKLAESVKLGVVLSDEVRDSILEMPGQAGHRTLYYFAQFPQEAERIGKLSVGAALRELGKIEDKVMAKTKKNDDAEKNEGEDREREDAEPGVSRAPKPATPLKSHSGPAPLEDEKGNLNPNLDFKAYKRARKEGKIK